MANLLTIAEVAYRQLFPNPTDEEAISVEEFIETAKTEFAFQSWLYSKNEKNQEGVYNIPSILLTETEPLPVVDDSIDISKLHILRSLSDDSWIQNVGGVDCDCYYVKTNVNRGQLLCDDDSIGDEVRRFMVVGNKIKFPNGTHEKKLSIIYANNGNHIDAETIEIDDAIGNIVRSKLIEVYGGKIGKEDETNNSNSNK